jgi:hypothetical protein
MRVLDIFMYSSLISAHFKALLNCFEAFLLCTYYTIKSELHYTSRALSSTKLNSYTVLLIACNCERYKLRIYSILLFAKVVFSSVGRLEHKILLGK